MKAGGNVQASKGTSKTDVTSTMQDKYHIGDLINSADMLKNQTSANDWFSSIINAARGGPGSVGAGPTGAGAGGVSTGTVSGDTTGANKQAEANISDTFSRMFKQRAAEAISGPTASQGGIARQGFAQGAAVADAQNNVVGQATDAASRLLASNAMNVQQAEAYSPRRQIGFGSNSNVSGGAEAGVNVCGGCWIFMHYLGRHLPVPVLAARYLHWTPNRERGYKAMSRWAIPLMRVNKWAARIGWNLVVRPMAAAAERKYGTHKENWRLALYPIAYLWLGIWSLVGHFSMEEI